MLFGVLANSNMFGVCCVMLLLACSLHNVIVQGTIRSIHIKHRYDFSAGNLNSANVISRIPLHSQYSHVIQCSLACLADVDTCASLDVCADDTESATCNLRNTTLEKPREKTVERIQTCKYFEVLLHSPCQFGGTYLHAVGKCQCVPGRFGKVCENVARGCHELYYSGHGVYLVSPDGGEPFHVYCYMFGVAFTVIQLRYDGSINFNRTWAEYVAGFGKLGGEHWLGLENIHRLTANKTKLIVKYASKNVHYEIHDWVRVLDASQSYRIENVDQVHGVGTLTSGISGLPFATVDNHTAGDGDECVRRSGGGWWYDLASTDRCCVYCFNGRLPLQEYVWGGVKEPLCGSMIVLPLYADAMPGDFNFNFKMLDPNW